MINVGKYTGAMYTMAILAILITHIQAGKKKKNFSPLAWKPRESNMLRMSQHTPWNIPQTLNPTLYEGISFIWG